MESILIDTAPLVAVPQRRDETFTPLKKFTLTGDHLVASYNPATGVTAPTVLNWVLGRDFDPNRFITPGINGVVNLNEPGAYQVTSRVTIRRDIPGNTQRVTFFRVSLLGYLYQADVAQITVDGTATTSLLRDETSPGAFDSSGTSLLTQMVVVVIPDTIYAPPLPIAVAVEQGSDLLQSQTVSAVDYDMWLQIAYLGRIDTEVDYTARYSPSGNQTIF